MQKIVNIRPNITYQLKITLTDVNPPIWRRFTVNPEIKFPDFHKVLQTIMGWTNTHLHQFRFNDLIYGYDEEELDDDIIDYRNIKLNKLIKHEKEKIIYDYDFGDGWEHAIILEKIIDNKLNQPPSPTCIDGERSCPPEDCGGPYGYEELLTALNNPKHEDHEEMLDWVGDEFNSEKYDIEYVNKMLKMKNFGCISFT
ncbi:MAG: plasmid pRiA4b ORF-3 family protein [Spirochaetia bacterium]|nr:plasmid pRiA4b ORF-3 family protein [Spirochaetia bacterium]